MKIPSADLAAQHKKIAPQLKKACEGVLKRGDFILGKDVAAFEREFAKMCGARFAAGVSSGTDALFLALAALGIGPGDEVIVPAYTFIATAFAVSYTGAQPVFADIDERSYNIAVQGIVRAVSPRTKAIIPVHLYGQPAQMDRIMGIAAGGGIRVIEDAAQAHGARIRMPSGTWKSAGNIGDMGCFSFYPSKNLGGLGDGGMVVTNDGELHKKLLSLRDCGRVSRYEHAEIGYNARLDTLQAAFLRVKLRYLDEWNESRRETAALYAKLLGGIDGLILPYAASDIEHVYHVYAVRFKARSRIISALTKSHIGAIIHYPIPIHLQPAYANSGYKEGDFPVAETVCKEILSLPMFPYMRRRQVEYVAETIKKTLKRG